jgi:hypothetical protein
MQAFSSIGFTIVACDADRGEGDVNLHPRLAKLPKRSIQGADATAIAFSNLLVSRIGRECGNSPARQQKNLVCKEQVQDYFPSQRRPITLALLPAIWGSATTAIS